MIISISYSCHIHYSLWSIEGSFISCLQDHPFVSNNAYKNARVPSNLFFVRHKKKKTGAEEICRLMGFRRSNEETRCSWQEASIRSRSKLLLLPFSPCTYTMLLPRNLSRAGLYSLLALTSKEIHPRIYFTFPLSKKLTFLSTSLYFYGNSVKKREKEREREERKENYEVFFTSFFARSIGF